MAHPAERYLPIVAWQQGRSRSRRGWALKYPVTLLRAGPEVNIKAGSTGSWIHNKPWLRARTRTASPNVLEGKLTFGGHMAVDGGRAEGEFRVGGNLDVGNGSVVKALIEASNVTIKGVVEGKLTARDKLTLGKAAKLNGDVQARRLQIEDGASLNGYVRMGDFEQHPG